MADADREKWDAKYARGEHAGADAPAWLDELADDLPAAGPALDIAAGDGRLAVWMARRGLDVTAVDVSSVGLALARERAEASGVAIGTLALDLEWYPLPPGPFALVTCFHYRQQSLHATVIDRLAPGGCVLFEQPTVRNLERHARPSRRFLAEPNELLRAYVEDLTVLYYRESWLNGIHRARLLACKKT